ncbi:MAG TPA: BamA/TamA family outer membrane protein [Ignavibacteria bacterium]|nr:BamA/TamA family outer membrane protein [Ignavibacteria bacterium]
MKTNKYLFAIFVILFVFLFKLNDSNELYGIELNKIGDSIEVVAGKEYDISGFSEIFLGKHWRDLWTKPFKVELLNLELYEGGLKPIKKGGGMQTKSLRFESKNGKKYKFRSINKDPRKVLQPDLRETFIADIMKDQISAAHPFAPVIVSEILDAVGILNSKPVPMYLPKSDKLGEYNKEYGDLLGTLEENPDDSPDVELSFGQADKITETLKLYKRLEKDNDEQVDSKEFLKVRLIDIMVGDWDRHYDQWLWAGYKVGGKTKWKPIPRDRDQAFGLYDGLLPMIVGRAITQIEGYGEDYPPMYDLTFNGRYVDRRFLPAVEKKDWDSLALFIKNNITDEVIRKAVNKMPVEWIKLRGDELFEMIKSRRDKIEIAKEEYYELINNVVDIYGSEKKEYLEIVNTACDCIKVNLYEISKDDGKKKDNPFFTRTFCPEVTDELRVYLLENEDFVSIGSDGNDLKDDILIRIIKEKDDLKFENSSGGDIRVYHKKLSSVKNAGNNVSINYDEFTRSKDEVEKYEPVTENRGYDWRIAFASGYNPDEGIILGGGPILYKYGFRYDPFENKMKLTGAYSTSLKSFNIEYKGEFYNIVKPIKLNLNLAFDELSVSRFYGFGNSTVFIENSFKDGSYNVVNQLIDITPELEWEFKHPKSLKSSLIFYTGYELFKMNRSKSGFIANNLTGNFSESKILKFGINLVLDMRDNPVEPYKGFYIDLSAGYNKEIGHLKDSFFKGKLELRNYISNNWKRPIVFAIRAVAEVIGGDHPFYQSAFLGGINSLRGFNEYRFSGNASLFSQAELRIPLGVINFLIPGVIGISGYCDVGSVYTETDQFEKVNTSLGGGLWISYLDRMLNLSVNLASSNSGLKVYVGSGILF